MRLVDFSSEIRAGMPRPGSAPEVEMEYCIRQSAEMEKEKGYSNKLEQFTITTHVGTHIDAPSHFTAKGLNIDQLDLENFYMVPTLLLDVEQQEYGEITTEALCLAQERSGKIRKGDLVILNTGFYRHYGTEAYLHPPYLTKEAAEYLVRAGISMLATDCFTVDDPRKKEKPAHVLFLKEYGIPVIECVLHLNEANASRFSSICFPLKIKDGSGAFTRFVGVFD